jgi:hypothetical protein
MNVDKVEEACVQKLQHRCVDLEVSTLADVQLPDRRGPLETLTEVNERRLPYVLMELKAQGAACIISKLGKTSNIMSDSLPQLYSRSSLRRLHIFVSKRTI